MNIFDNLQPTFPTDKDRYGAMAALFRLQDVYELSAEELYEGKQIAIQNYIVVSKNDNIINFFSSIELFCLVKSSILSVANVIIMNNKKVAPYYTKIYSFLDF